MPLGRGKRTAFPPPVRNGALQTGRSGNNGRPAPDPAGAKRPPGAGRALAGGFGPRLVLIPAQRCGRGDGPCHGSDETAFTSPGGNRKRTAFPLPARDGAALTGRCANMQKASAREGRVGHAQGRGNRPGQSIGAEDLPAFRSTSPCGWPFSAPCRDRAPAPAAPARPRRSAKDRLSGADPGAAALALLLIWPYHNLSFGPKAQQRNPG
jgi:hypothetical protein